MTLIGRLLSNIQTKFIWTHTGRPIHQAPIINPRTREEFRIHSQTVQSIRTLRWYQMIKNNHQMIKNNGQMIINNDLGMVQAIYRNIKSRNRYKSK